jgi:hypothetical protein
MKGGLVLGLVVKERRYLERERMLRPAVSLNSVAVRTYVIELF